MHTIRKFHEARTFVNHSIYVFKDLEAFVHCGFRSGKNQITNDSKIHA
jgi:hypothetical protein